MLCKHVFLQPFYFMKTRNEWDLGTKTLLIWFFAPDFKMSVRLGEKGKLLFGVSE